MENGKISAGILLYRYHEGTLEVFLVRSGGPYFKHKEQWAWSIPKGLVNDGENHLLETARREFFEETGHKIDGKFIALQPLKQKSGKLVYSFAVEGDIDPEKLVSNTFEMEWPPKSGKRERFPEIERGGWFDIPKALETITEGQKEFIHELQGILL